MRVNSFIQKDIHEAIEVRTMVEPFAVPTAIIAVKISNHLLELLVPWKDEHLNSSF